MSTATGRVSGADTRARGWRSPVGSACAVHTEVAAANVVTPSAAARSRPFQRLPLCRAMSARPFAVSADVVHRWRQGSDRAGSLCYRSRTKPQGAGDNHRRSATDEERVGLAGGVRVLVRWRFRPATVTGPQYVHDQRRALVRTACAAPG